MRGLSFEAMLLDFQDRRRARRGPDSVAPAAVEKLETALTAAELTCQQDRSALYALRCLVQDLAGKLAVLAGVKLPPVASEIDRVEATARNAALEALQRRGGYPAEFPDHDLRKVAATAVAQAAPEGLVPLSELDALPAELPRSLPEAIQRIQALESDVKRLNDELGTMRTVARTRARYANRAELIAAKAIFELDLLDPGSLARLNRPLDLESDYTAWRTTQFERNPQVAQQVLAQGGGLPSLVYARQRLDRLWWPGEVEEQRSRVERRLAEDASIALQREAVGATNALSPGLEGRGEQH